ncbi:hypothetical protein M9H77_21768 [Catharanthus roseus]|uniref:Uncharacterized protein n=1 Tax=Catharanthus roseus TaxID=4058 RepID=A0ACC0AQ05_CATRO|nr:hypothetical protein M9H77_21768 [Catharanthus roseus]
MEKTFLTGKIFVNWSVKKASNYWKTSIIRRLLVRENGQETWQSPQEGYLKCNFDATFDPDGTTFSSCIIREHMGEALGLWTRKDIWERLADSFAAEATVLNFALNVGHDMEEEHMIYDVDAFFVIHAIKGMMTVD